MASNPAAVAQCRFCGRAPAVQATVRAHRGMILIMQWRHLRGPFCRECGMRALRKLTTDTLWQGWWGPISLVLGTPFALLSNLFAWMRIRSLPAPVAMSAPAAAPAVPGAMPGAASMAPPPPPPAPAAPPAPEAAEG
jgi:hypothetical protein